MLRKRAAEYKKAAGEAPADEKLHEIPWSVLDPESKMKAIENQKSMKSFDELTGHIDERYRITFGNLEVNAVDLVLPNL